MADMGHQLRLDFSTRERELIAANENLVKLLKAAMTYIPTMEFKTTLSAVEDADKMFEVSISTGRFNYVEVCLVPIPAEPATRRSEGRFADVNDVTAPNVRPVHRATTDGQDRLREAHWNRAALLASGDLGETDDT